MVCDGLDANDTPEKIVDRVSVGEVLKRETIELAGHRGVRLNRELAGVFNATIYVADVPWRFENMFRYEGDRKVYDVAPTRGVGTLDIHLFVKDNEAGTIVAKKIFDQILSTFKFL